MRITLLGTGSSTGVPLIGCECEVCKSKNKKDKRFRSSILIQTNNKNFIIDTTPDFRYQMLKHSVKSINAVLYTHYHRDHLAGIDDLRAYNFIQKKEVSLYSNASTAEALKSQYPFCFNTASIIPNTLDATVNIIDPNKDLIIENEIFTPIQFKHYDIDVLGYRIEHFSYVTDISYISEEEKEKIKGSKILVLSALRQQTHKGHFNLEQAIDFAQKLNIPKTIFTHMSHQMGLHNKVSKTLPKNMNLGYDGMTFSI